MLRRSRRRGAPVNDTQSKLPRGLSTGSDLVGRDRDRVRARQIAARCPFSARRRLNARLAARRGPLERDFAVFQSVIARPPYRHGSRKERYRPYDGCMTDEATPDQLRAELREIDNELAELRRVTGDVQSRRGEDSDTSEGFQEPEDIATELTGLNETEAVIDVLEQRRERLEAQLKALG